MFSEKKALYTFLTVLTLVLINPSYIVRAEYTDVTYPDEYDNWTFTLGDGSIRYLAARCEITFRHHYSEFFTSSTESDDAGNQIRKPPPLPWDYWTVQKLEHIVWISTDNVDWYAVDCTYTIDILSAGTQNILLHIDTAAGYGWETFYPNVGEIDGPDSVDCRWFFDWATYYSHKFTTKYCAETWTHHYGYYY